MRLWDFDPPQFIPTKVEELQCLVFGSFLAYFAYVLIFGLTSTKKGKGTWRVVGALCACFPVLALPLYFYGVSSLQ